MKRVKTKEAWQGGGKGPQGGKKGQAPAGARKKKRGKLGGAQERSTGDMMGQYIQTKKNTSFSLALMGGGLGGG